MDHRQAWRAMLIVLACAAPVAVAADEPIATPVHLDAASLALLPRESVVASAHGKTLPCEGVALVAVLRAAGAMPDGPLRGAQLARRVDVTARDGYRVVFALAELDPATGPTRAYVVDRCDGAPLDATDGPLRLVVPTDARPARWIRQIDALHVSTVPAREGDAAH